jgi:uncharacterized protein (DUF608 family)
MALTALTENPRWPVLTRYDRQHLARIALPLGGIGTGTVSLGGRGDLRDWEIVNRPAKGFQPRNTFFALYAKAGDSPAVVKALEGPIDPQDYEGATGCRIPNHGLPRFRDCSFAAAYPLGQVLLSDPDVPLDVRLEAFNPLVPCDADASGIPAAVLRYVLINKTDQTVRASVCGSMENFIGSDGTNGKPSRNLNQFWQAITKEIQGVLMKSEGVDPKAEQWGSIALATTAQSGVTHRTAWAKRTWGDSLLDFWDDFGQDGQLEDRDAEGVDNPQASLCVAVEVPPGASQTVTFILAWHFPNRQTWTPAKPPDTPGAPGACGCSAPPADANWIGNWYATLFNDAWHTASRTAQMLDDLEERTLKFLDAFCRSDLPEVVKEAALYNLSSLRTQTTFRAADGRMYGWEGCGDKSGCCHGSCTHVWNYEQATAFLFGGLARTMREVEFLYCTRDDGHMSFRTNLPLDRAAEWHLAAADGQMGCIMKLYRDWQLSGDVAMLDKLWPKARKALEFCWIPGGWDADRDGVMEGCQHNTMDVEYYGPNPQMTGWYLGALRAAEEMARHLRDFEFADTCRDLFNRGSAWMDQNLFNGEYYEHQVRPPAGESAIAPGLRHESMGARDLSEPELQLGPGCLVDQLVGQFLAHVSGLGYLHKPENVHKTLQSILEHNFKTDFRNHFNHLRSFVMNDESALLMATYPRGRRPRRPFPYYNEVMTGFEYTAAVGMIYEGMVADGLKCIAAIRQRYDGLKRSPFDEAECGHHYARAMASWAAVLALTGFRYSAVRKSIEFAPLGARKPSRVFWSNGFAWGTCLQQPADGGIKVTLEVIRGDVTLSRLTLGGYGTADLGAEKTVREGNTIEVLVKQS